MSILLTPARIGGVEIKNRIIMPPMTTRLSDDEGHVTDDTIAYYMARVRGGVGMITVEMASPERAGRHRRRELGIYDDRFLPGLTRLVDAIHGGGAKASIQLGHGGGHTRRDICGETPVAPSAIPHPVYEVTNETIVPEAMTRERIAETVAAFARAGARAKAAGFDCVEIHAAHGYLISQFVTPFENRRTDEYGGSLENRARFGLEVLRAVKAAVGTMPVIYRLSVDDYFPEGLGPEDGVQIAIWAAQAGADALHIAAGHYRSLPSGERMIPPMAYPEATFLDYAAAVKKRVAVPVIAVGRLGHVKYAEEALGNGKADFVALGRIADRGSGMGREDCARRATAPLPCLQHLRERDARRRATALRGQRRRRPRTLVLNRARPPANERIAVIGARPRRADLCVAGGGEQCSDGVRACRAQRRRVPLCRQGAAVPGRRRRPEFVRPLHRGTYVGLRGERRDHPLSR